MEENSKINRRSRPRPYDLRRKVLLKNFLREQMTYIPQARLTSSIQNNDANFVVESCNAFGLDEDLTELNDENSSSSPVSEAGDSKSSENVEENNLVSDINDIGNGSNTEKPAAVANSADGTHEPKFFRFASLMNLRSESKKKKVKGILKAKKVCKTVKSPVKSRSFKTGLDRLFSGRNKTSRKSSQDQAAKNSSKSLFSLFKSRREQRKEREVDRIKQSISTDIKSPNKNEKQTSQSVQTDNSWAREELSRVKESNKLLREENRLLSESLSYFMSSNSLDSQLNHCGSPLQSSNRDASSFRTSSGSYDNSSRNSYSYDSWNPRSRILRSKSVQEYSDRRYMSRNSYRTRSMNYHNFQSNSLNNRSSSSVSPYSVQAREVSIPRVRKKNMSSLPVSSTVRVIQRRSSMPERILSENDRSRICRRAGSVRDGSSRTPFHSLPAEAFY